MLFDEHALTLGWSIELSIALGLLAAFHEDSEAFDAAAFVWFEPAWDPGCPD